jgi:ABC-type Fe3+/spermidine/putrescine transport system ATPase subunit
VLHDRAAFMNRGRVSSHAEPTATYEQPCGALVAPFVGETNLHGQVRAATPDGLMVEVADSLFTTSDGRNDARLP